MFGLCAPRLRPSRSAHVASQCGRNTEIAVRFDKTPTEPVGAETRRKMDGGSIPTNLLQAAMQLMEGDTTEIADVSAHLRRLRFGTSIVPVRALTVSLLLSGRITLRRRDRVEVTWYVGELLFSIEESEVVHVIGSVEVLCFTFRLDALFLSDLLQSDDIRDFSSSATVETPFIVLADDEWLMSLTGLLRLAARSGLRKERLLLIVQELHCLALLTLEGRASPTSMRRARRFARLRGRLRGSPNITENRSTSFGLPTTCSWRHRPSTGSFAVMSPRLRCSTSRTCGFARRVV